VSATIEALPPLGSGSKMIGRLLEARPASKEPYDHHVSVMQNRLVSAGLLGLRERSVQVSGQQPQRVRCITRTFA
jgi:hypothetical protein